MDGFSSLTCQYEHTFKVGVKARIGGVLGIVFGAVFGYNAAMELEKLDFRQIFEEVAPGNRAAQDFCHAFLAWVHFLDDMVDQDKPEAGPEDIIRLNLELAMVFAFNPFWQEHKTRLIPLIIQGAQAYADSNEWAKSVNARDRLSSDVLKSQYAEVFWHVAYLCGGPELLQQVTRKYRRFNYDVVA